MNAESASNALSNQRKERISDPKPSIGVIKNWKSCQFSGTTEKSQNREGEDITWPLAALTTAVDSRLWSGVLLKKGRALLRPWQPRWFELNLLLKGTEARKALLVYLSPGKGSRSLYIEDARREQHLDAGTRVAFSLGVTPADTAAAAAAAAGTPSTAGERRRMLVMAATDFEAVAFLSCLRGILAPGRAAPQPQGDLALHYPNEALAQLLDYPPPARTT